MRKRRGDGAEGRYLRLVVTPEGATSKQAFPLQDADIASLHPPYTCLPRFAGGPNETGAEENLRARGIPKSD